MPDLSVLQIRLYGEQIGALTRVQGDRNIFTFDQAYIDNRARPTLSLSFKDEAGNDDVTEFIRRLVFNTLIGNADMHLKNWSLIYKDRRKTRLSPAYDFVSTIPYIADENSALTYARTKRMSQFSRDELAYLADKARLPEKLVLNTAAETVERFHEAWKSEKGNLPLSKDLIATIEAHVKTIPIANK